MVVVGVRGGGWSWSPVVVGEGGGGHRSWLAILPEVAIGGSGWRWPLVNIVIKQVLVYFSFFKKQK